jgi:hypothetical protein
MPASLIKFKDTFRERVPEWVCAICLIGWGLIVLNESTLLWDQGYFHVLSNIASQKFWGYATTIVGIFRALALAFNGAWRPAAHVRAFGALLGVLLWSGIVISYITLPYAVPAIASKSALLALDLFALWYAAGDAKLADIKAYKLTEARKKATG